MISTVLPSTYLRRIENAWFPLWTLESTVGQFPVVPEVCLLDRPVPSNGEKGQSEALRFLNFRGGGVFDFLILCFSVIFRDIVQQKDGNSPSFLSCQIVSDVLYGFICIFPDSKNICSSWRKYIQIKW